MSKQRQPARSLVSIAGIVAFATLISKIFGLVRTQAIAAAFGIGEAANAYNYAYVIPGFLFVLLGGINGPFHSAIVSVIAKRKQEEVAPLVETITTLVGGLLLLVTIALIVFADPLTSLIAPGLSMTPAEAQIHRVSPQQLQSLAHTRVIAVRQLQIMAPMALLAGLIGIGFGTLNSASQYWLLSLSPLFSSVTVLGGLGILVLQLGHRMTQPQYAMLGGVVLAWGTLAGAVLQWLVQLVAQWRAGLGTIRLRFDFRSAGVREVLNIMGPATFSSGMMSINVYTDLFFASYIPGAAATFSYAGLLVQTPLGIVSNVILLPLLPMLSRLADPLNWAELKVRIRQGLIFTAITMMPLGALMVALASPIVRIIYQRYAFDQAASQLVTPTLMAYGVGMFAYLGRDVLVRVFYALGDGNTPFRISVANIFLNAALDYVLVKPFSTPGLVLATVGVNIISMVMLVWLLDRKLNGLPWREWTWPILGLAIGSFVAGVASWGTFWGCQQIWGTGALLAQIVQLSVAGLIGIGIFALIATRLNLPEVDILISRLRQRLTK